MTTAYHHLLTKKKSRMTLDELAIFRQTISAKIRVARTCYNISATSRLSYSKLSTMESDFRRIGLEKHVEITVGLLQQLLYDIDDA